MKCLGIENYLWHKNQAECDGSAEDDEKCNDEVGIIWPIFDDEGDGDSRHTHDNYIVHTHSNVFWVIEGCNADLAGLPC